MKYKISGLLLFLGMLLAFVFPCHTYASSSGEWNDTITWKVDDNYTLTFNGSGVIDREDHINIYPFDGSEIKKIIISDGITELANGPFQDFVNLEEVKLGKDLKKIGNNSFASCFKLRKISFPESLELIGDGAFYSCTDLTEVTLVNGLKSIGVDAFRQSGITEINLLHVENLGERAFYECSNLKTVNLGDKITILNDLTFKDCISLESITIPKTLTKIEAKVFGNVEKLCWIFYDGTEEDWNKIIIDWFDDNWGGDNNILKTVSIKYKEAMMKPVLTVSQDSTAMRLSWTKAADVATYRVYKSINNSEYDVLTIKVDTMIESQRNCLDKGPFQNNDEIKYYVIALDEKQNQIKSNTVSISFQQPNLYTASRDGWCLTNNDYSYGEEGKFKIDPKPFYSMYEIFTLKTTLKFLEDIVGEVLGLNDFSGYCFGLSMLSAANYHGIYDLSKHFHNDLSQYNFYGTTSLSVYGFESIVTTSNGKRCFSVANNKDALNLINRAYLMQYSKEFHNTRIFEDDEVQSFVGHLLYDGPQDKETMDDIDPWTRRKYRIDGTLENETILATFVLEGFRHSVLIDLSKPIEHLGSDTFKIYLYDPNAPINALGIDNLVSEYKFQSWLEVNTFDCTVRYKVCDGNGKCLKDVKGTLIKFYDIGQLETSNFSGPLHVYDDTFVYGGNIEMYEDNVLKLKCQDGEIIDSTYDYDGVYDGSEGSIPFYHFCSESDNMSYVSNGQVRAHFLSDNRKSITMDTSSDAKVEMQKSQGKVKVSADEYNICSLKLFDGNSENDPLIIDAKLLRGNDLSAQIDEEKLTLSSSADITVEVSLEKDGEKGETTLVKVPANQNVYIYMADLNDSAYYNRIIATGNVTDNIQWKLDAAGHLTITGDGAIPDYDSLKNTPWYEYRSHIRSVSIEGPISRIGANAFYSRYSVLGTILDNLETVTMSNYVTSIGENAFYNCSGMKNITFSNRLNRIEKGAFFHCQSLETLILPDSLETLDGPESTDYVILDQGIFAQCSSLKSVTIPEKLTYIPVRTFSSCESLKSLVLKGENITIDSFAFEGCAFEELKLDENIACLKENAFHDCNRLKTLTISSVNTRIEQSVFASCDALEKVYFMCSACYGPYHGMQEETDSVGHIIKSGCFGENENTVIYYKNNAGWTQDQMDSFSLGMKYQWKVYEETGTAGGNASTATTATQPPTQVIVKKQVSISAMNISKKYSAKKCKKKAQVFPIGAFASNNAALTYRIVWYSKNARKTLSLDPNTGWVKVKKKAKKGTYTINVYISSMESIYYYPAGKIITVKVKVK